MNTELNRIERILRFTIEQLNKLLSALILLISLFLFMQVLFRYVFHFPLYWVEEVVKYLMIYVTTIGGGVAFYDSGHPRIIVFCNMLPQKIRPYYEIALRILILFFAGVFIFIGTRYALDNWWIATSALEIPYTWPYLALPIGGLVIFFILILDNCDILFHKRSFLESFDYIGELK